ncbi:Calcium-activated potassium channel subunit alpha-1 [Cichlidogyrus casuarinus]|uniref:Calcium-activated potassium channel subunit alpha-1 n=1 Tax=Cichlidogyrus casuarinus TaxID=1844966 RepID=A0ABD2PXC2_9PLAT
MSERCNKLTVLNFQIFMMLFILGSLAAFTKIVPEIVELLMQFNKYGGKFECEPGRNHVVVCGDVRPESMRNFLDDFLHKDRKRTDVAVVFINQRTPDLIMKSLLRLHFTRVKYFQGTVMNVSDLDRVKVADADACIILANAQCASAEDEDAANIMRVIAVKNYCARTRVIVQLLNYSSKAYLLNIPGWSWYNGDEIICFSELKLGFLAQSCVAPGFSTLLTNLFSMRSLHSVEDAVQAVYHLETRLAPIVNQQSFIEPDALLSEDPVRTPNKNGEIPPLDPQCATKVPLNNSPIDVLLGNIKLTSEYRLL